MLRLAVSVSALAILTGAAVAADLPPSTPMPPPMMSPTPMAYNWSGFYFGAHGGWGFGSGAFDDGAIIGGQIGVNWQWNQFVLGVEGDGSWSDMNGVDSLESLRGRVGIPIGRFLVYATGGGGFQDFNDVGWVAGGGAEYALSDSVSVGAEFLHYDFGADDANVVRGRINVKFNSLFGG